MTFKKIPTFKIVVKFETFETILVKFQYVVFKVF